MIRSNVATMSRKPYHPPPAHPPREYYGRGSGGGRGDDGSEGRWTSPHPAPFASCSTAARDDDRREQEAVAAASSAASSVPMWQDPATSAAAGYAAHPPHPSPSVRAAAAAAASHVDRGSSCSPFPPHHPLAPEHLAFDDLENDPVATSSMDSGTSPEDEEFVEDRKLPAARASSARRGADPRKDDLGFEHRHRKRHSLDHDPFEGLSARLFPSEDPLRTRNIGGVAHDDYHDDDVDAEEEEEDAKPKASFDDVLHLPALAHPTSHFYAPEGQLYDVVGPAPADVLMHSPHPSHSFAATPTYATSHAAMLHHYHSPSPPFHRQPHHHGPMASPMPMPRPVPPPQIYRFGHSAPPHFGPRPPPDVGFPEPSPPPYGYGPPQQQLLLPQDYASDPRGLARATPTAKARPAKKSQRRKAPRTAPVMAATARRRGSGSRSSVDSGSGSSSGGGGGKPRGSSPSKRSAASVGAGSSTRSGERTSQVRHSPTDDELREAKTPRAKMALTNWYRRLYDLIEYKNEHGDCNVPQKYSPNSALGTPSAWPRMMCFPRCVGRSHLSVISRHVSCQQGCG
jgi:hypothetical protein